MATYLFRRSGAGLTADGALAAAVKAAVQEIRALGLLLPQRWSCIETPDADGGYVLLSSIGEVGWHYHQAQLFRRHGITCALYPSA